MAPRFLHSLVIERSTSGARDDYGNPAQTWVTLSAVQGLVQPKTWRTDTAEVSQLSQGGPVASDHTIYLWPTDVREADRIRFDPDDGRKYQIVAVRDAAGVGHHLEIDANLVTVN